MEREVVVQEHPHPDIELPPINQHRLLNVLLDHEGAGFEHELLVAGLLVAGLVREGGESADVPQGLFLVLQVLGALGFPPSQVQVVQEEGLQIVEVIKYLDTPSSVQASGFEEPEVTVSVDVL